jgi:hypothetical protein
MPGRPYPFRESVKTMPGKHRKHTPLTSKVQRGMFGAELARRRRGEAPHMPSITTEELESHLRESRGKKLPKRVKKRK